MSAGVVYLVGAGPGDPGLVSARAQELVERADVIVHDRLVPTGLLSRASPAAELIYAGKAPGQPGIGQDEINRLLIEHGRDGRTVVRLKGGDPFVFGRGGEEAQALAAAGIRFEVVPGITAGIAAPAYAGIPVTHRDAASAVAFVTAHEDPAKGESSLDWHALAAFPGTLVFYMGVRNLDRVAERLIAEGRDPTEPAAVVERGTQPGQRTVSAPLGEIAARAAEESVGAPAVTVVGAVTALSEELAWFGQGPLRGRRVAVTRARAQASELAARLEALGAEVIEAPAIRIESLADSPEVAAAVTAIAERRYDVVCLTSPNGARLLLDALEAAGLDARAFAGATLAAIGPGTAAALLERGLRADIVPERSIAESLAQEIVSAGVGGKRVLVARAREARDVLPETLTGAGADVHVVAVYETVREPLGEADAAAVEKADYVTFTSSSTVRFFSEALGGAGGLPEHARVVSIGPVTSATARELGIGVAVEADRHDIDGLVAALVADAMAASS
jgi:uroporphyrinogen III methyltransferase/synthase